MLSLVGWHAAEYIIGSAFAAREELAGMVFLPTGFTGSVQFTIKIHKNVIFSKFYENFFYLAVSAQIRRPFFRQRACCSRKRESREVRSRFRVSNQRAS
jgi:hypothetical protein